MQIEAPKITVALSRPSRQAAAARKTYIEDLCSSADSEDAGDDGSDFEVSE